jgi:hypothetical protein
MGPAKRSQDHVGDDAMARRKPHFATSPAAPGSESPAPQLGRSSGSGRTEQPIPIRDNEHTSSSNSGHAASASRRKRKRGDPSTDGPDPRSDSGPRPRAPSTTTTPPPRRPLAVELGIQQTGSAEQQEGDSRAVELVDGRCDVQVHSVLSSSKMQKKVASVLRHLDMHPYAAPSVSAAASSGASGSGKPRVSVLRARACDAGKLVSIAEIAKREIADGVWFQYMALGEEVRDVARTKGRGDDTVVEETRLEGARRGENKDNDDEGRKDVDDDFEVMKTRFERAVEGTPKKRAVAIVSLFLARVSINELKQRFGEQTK